MPLVWPKFLAYTVGAAWSSCGRVCRVSMQLLVLLVPDYIVPAVRLCVLANT